MSNILIVGGGTAGWITAIFARELFPTCRITLIESSDIGILGAGEGSTPTIINFFEDFGIELADLFKHASATIKNGIKFTNWNGDNQSYFHPFNDAGLAPPIFDHSLAKISQGDNLDYTFSSWLNSLSYKVKARYDQNIYSGHQFKFDGGYSVHFNARQLATFLKSTGQKRNINVIDGVVSNIFSDNDGFITGVQLENGDVVNCDFVFDCTGFKRLFIGKHFGSEWVSYKESIPNNRAIPFFLDINSDLIPPYTEAIAMKYGWVWKIPVQDRYGCGYVFDSTCATDDEIKEEIKQLFGENIEFPTVFSFEAGTYKEVWIKNCMAIGLSSGFIEPLEATSIWMQLNTLYTLKNNLSGVLLRDQSYIDRLNEIIFNQNEKILGFIYLHYFTKRADTNYWQNFKEKNLKPRTFLEFKNICEKTIDFPGKDYQPFQGVFERVSLLAVGAGINFFDREKALSVLQVKEHFQPGYIDELYEKIKVYERKIYRLNRQSITHKEFIETMKQVIQRNINEN